MKRDGATISLWQDTVHTRRANTPFTREQYFDVVVVGGGMTGLATALQLQKAGKSVLVAEAQNIGFGTTGGTTAHLNNFLETSYTELSRKFGKDKTVAVAKAARLALELVKRNVQEYGIDCGYEELPGYVYAQTDEQAEQLDDILKGLQEVNLEASLSNTIPLRIPFQKAVEIPAQAQFHPTRYISGLARAFEEGGGIIAENCRVTDVEETEILSIQTSQGTVKAGNLIYATHIPPGVNLLHFRCAPYRSYVIAAQLKNKEDYPRGLAYDLYNPYRYFRTQTIDGKPYLVAGGEDHKTAHDENPAHRFLKLEAYLRTFYEVDRIAYRWSSQYYEPVDGLAYIGHLPGHQQNMFVATGYGGNGMTFSHIAALLLPELLISGKHEFKDLFDPNRIKPVAGFSKFVKEAADVVGHLVGGVFSRDKLESLVELAPGEADVVVYEGHKIALYKDEEGQLHALHSACTHIKCHVAWNAAEKTWDCPCHGSRFSYDGTVFNAPARKDLEPVRIEELAEK